jgi:hypothetical protein
MFRYSLLFIIYKLGVHRNMGAHISKLQSIFLDTKWTEDSLKIFEENGNKKMNEFYEHNLNETKKPNENSTVYFL